LTFNVYGPDDASCSTPLAVPLAVTVNGAGSYQSGNYTPTVAGAYRWIAHYSGDANNPAVNTACNEPIETSFVTPLPPTLTTTASGPTPVGQAIHDTAQLSGGTAPLTGTLTFNVYGPDDASCSTPLAVPPAVTVNGTGSYQSGNYTPTVAGAYRWIAHYSGNANNPAVNTACNEPNETSVVTETLQPGLSLAKSASPTTYHAAGEIITYTYIVTNTGQATLSGPVMVNDDRLGTFACGPAANLVPGASVTCARTYVIQPTDLGNVLNLPLQQQTNATYGPWLGGANSTMDVILSGNAPGSAVPNGTYAGWCVEEFINGDLYHQLATLYASTHLNLPSDVAGLPWGKVNYILNHKVRGVGKTDRDYFMDVQAAIWVVLGQPTPAGEISTDAQQMIDAANAHPDYVPGPTDTVAVIVYSDGMHSTGDLLQEVILEAKLGQIANQATATATAGGITVTSNQAVVTIRFVPLDNAVTIQLQRRPSVKSKS
jgi:uncharacterized repeat protein (TIGR01451 family)